MSEFDSSKRDASSRERDKPHSDGVHNGDSYSAVHDTGDDYDEEHGYNDRGEHSPMYNVDMDPEDRTAVFDLALEDDSDDGGGLLDWSILAGKQKRKYCGCDWSWLPCCNCTPPAWWLSLSRRQRLALQGCLIASMVLLLFVVLTAVILTMYK